MDKAVKAGVFLALVLLLGVPLALRPARTAPSSAKRLVIITPHNEQIRSEFAHAFSQWHLERFDEPVAIDWRNPGGTSEIRRLLDSQYIDAISRGRILPDGTLAPGAEPMPYDLFFGGGTYDHGQAKIGVRATPPGATEQIAMPLSIPAGFPQAQLDEWFGENVIGSGPLYDPPDPARNDPGQYWLGVAVSGFGIVYNRDVLRALDLPDPVSWRDLTDPRLVGWIALADPRQSGSVATTYDSILNNYGWDEGWRTLRLMSANARYFSSSSSKVPLDVSQGQAAVGIAIDFYGRYQAQAVMRPGETPETSRVGYIDPPGEVYIDADPITLLRAGPNPELARRFIDFCLTEKAQSLWQFPAHERLRAEGLPVPEDALGPHRFELRRMPVRRIMFERHLDRMVDRVNPFLIASTVPIRGWRSAVGPIMGAFSIDIHDEQAAAWKAIIAARNAGAPTDLLAEMDRLFFAMPTHTMPDGSELEFNEANFRAIRADWRNAGRDARPTWNEMRLGYTLFFRDNYRRIVELARSAGVTG